MTCALEARAQKRERENGVTSSYFDQQVNTSICRNRAKDVEGQLERHVRTADPPYLKFRLTKKALRDPRLHIDVFFKSRQVSEFKPHGWGTESGIS